MKKTIIYLSMFMLLSSFAYAFVDTDSALFGWWRLDDAGSSMTDSKNNGKTLCPLLYNGAEQQQPAIPSYSTFSLGFDDNTAVSGNCTAGPMLTMKNFTIFVWVGEIDYSSEKNVLKFNDPLDGGQGFDFRAKTGNMEFIVQVPSSQIISSAGKKGSLYILMYNGTDYSLMHNVSNHIEVVATFVTGNVLDQTPISKNFSIGTPTSGNSVNANIDDVAVFNRSLSSAEILDYFNNGLSSDSPINSSWNVTSNNTVSGENTSVWRKSGSSQINITTSTLSIAVNTNKNTNGSCRVDIEQNHSEMIASNPDFKFATTDTTDHAYTIAGLITKGNHCLYCSFKDPDGNGPAGANSSSGCLSFTLTTAPVSNISLLFNGIEANRTYEYETTVNISINSSNSSSSICIDILDNTNRVINECALGNLTKNYTIDILRINKISGNLSKNISSGNDANVTIDNRTDLFNATINLTGFNSPDNITLNYTNLLFFPGTLITNNLYQNKFIFSGESTEKKNLSFPSAGAITIFINFSNQGNIPRTGYLNFTINGFTFNEEDSFKFQENFSNNSKGGWFDSDNITIYGNTTSDAIDDFEDGNFNGWDFLTSVGAVSVVEDPDGNYMEMSQSNSDSSVSNTGFSNIAGFDLRESYEFSTNLWYTICRNAGSYGCQGGGGAEIGIYISDGTVHVPIFNDYFYDGCGCTIRYLNISGVKKNPKSIDIFTDQGFLISKDLGSLDSSKKWVLRLNGAASGRNWKPMSGNYEIRVYSVSLSGVSLNLVTNYSVNTSSNFTSNILTKTTESIATVFLNATVFKPNRTTINFYVSNDNLTYEPIINGQTNFFTSTGDNLSVRYELSTELHNVTPRVYSYVVQLITGSVSGLNIDVGNDQINDMNINFTINSTSTPIRYTGNDSGINNYINRTSSDEFILIPIVITADSDGIIELSNFNLTENINPVRLNLSSIQTLNSIPFRLTYSNGQVQLNDIRLDFRGSHNITVRAYTEDETIETNSTILVKYSPFNISFPSIATAWEIFPGAANQSNIEPFGQNSTHGIWEIKSDAYDGDIDIYVRYNQTIDTCVTKQEFRGHNFSASPLTNISTLNVTNLTAFNQLLVTNLNFTSVANIRSFTMINCSESTESLIIPYFCFNSICSDCVITEDFTDNCQVIE